jgi:hypothetical protein
LILSVWGRSVSSFLAGAEEQGVHLTRGLVGREIGHQKTGPVTFLVSSAGIILYQTAPMLAISQNAKKEGGCMYL